MRKTTALSSPTDKQTGPRSRTVIAPVIEFLRRHAPFDRMAAPHLEFLAERLTLGFYAKDETITSPEAGEANTFYIIKQGRVRGESGSESAEGAWELHPGECFPLGALLSRRAVRMPQRAAEDTFCFELARDDFDRLYAISPEFRDFCSRRLASLLDQTLRTLQAAVATRMSSETSLGAPLKSLVRRSPVACLSATPIRAALATMNAEHVGSIAVTDDTARPVGIFTLHDLLSRVAAANVDLDAPIMCVMTPAPLTLSAEAPAHEAALLMASHGFGHVCVVERGRLVGVVSERDLFSLQRVGMVNLSRSITHAPDVATLARLGRDVHRFIDQMLAQGVSVAQLAQIVTLLNDRLTRRAIALCRAEVEEPEASFTWLAFGSEGRQEQTLRTDQDNGILFAVPPGMTAEAVRARLLPLAKRINQALADIGFPLCPGNVMAGNPECCLSLDEWRARFVRWIDQGTPEHLLKASIFFDFRALEDNDAPVNELRSYVLERCAANPRFLRQMAENALRNRPPLGLMRDFVVPSSGAHPHTLDLKLQGTTPFVDGARLLALAHGLAETNTLARLRAAARAGAVRSEEAEAWCDAYGFLQLLRMRHHQQQQGRGETLDNHVDPDSLNELDRRVLKEAFRQARKLQSRLALDYRL